AKHPVAVWENPIQETPNNQEESKKVDSAQPKNSPNITAIGDSVMIDIAPYLKNTFPDIRIDAQIGRQLS
ncbi:acetyltransferase, partial [Bacillus cereus]